MHCIGKVGFSLAGLVDILEVSLEVSNMCRELTSLFLLLIHFTAMYQPCIGDESVLVMVSGTDLLYSGCTGVS